jgi:hypothetical protein
MKRADRRNTKMVEETPEVRTVVKRFDEDEIVKNVQEVIDNLYVEGEIEAPEDIEIHLRVNKEIEVHLWVGSQSRDELYRGEARIWVNDIRKEKVRIEERLI